MKRVYYDDNNDQIVYKPYINIYIDIINGKKLFEFL